MTLGRGDQKINHLVFRLNYDWMEKKVFELTRAEILIFHTKTSTRLLLDWTPLHMPSVKPSLGKRSIHFWDYVLNKGGKVRESKTSKMSLFFGQNPNFSADFSRYLP